MNSLEIRLSEYNRCLEQSQNDPKNPKKCLMKHFSFAYLCDFSKRTLHDFCFEKIASKMSSNQNLDTLYGEYQQLCTDQISVNLEAIEESHKIAQELNTSFAHSIADFVDKTLFLKWDLSPISRQEFERIAKMQGAVFRPITPPSLTPNVSSSSNEELVSPKSSGSSVSPTPSESMISTSSSFSSSPTEQQLSRTPSPTLIPPPIDSVVMLSALPPCRPFTNPISSKLTSTSSLLPSEPVLILRDLPSCLLVTNLIPSELCPSDPVLILDLPPPGSFRHLMGTTTSPISNVMSTKTLKPRPLFVFPKELE